MFHLREHREQAKLHSLQDIGRPDIMREFPCFAYTSGRSAGECVLRASMHCQTVKQLIQDRQSATPLGPASLQGGLQICVDLSQAFDRVPRRLVEDSKRSALPWPYVLTYATKDLPLRFPAPKG